MNAVLWIAIGLAVSTGFAPVSRGGWGRVDERALGRLTRRTGLRAEPARRAEVLPGIVRRERWSFGAAVVGLLLAVLACVVLGAPPNGTGVAAMVGACVGGGLGALAATVRPRGRRSGPRVARSRAAGLEDYVPRRLLLVARVAVAAAWVTTVSAVLVTRPVAHPPSGLGWWLALLAVAALAVTGYLVAAEVAMRRVLDRPQPAASPLELAWDDVGRSQALRHLAVDATVLAGGVILGSLLVTLNAVIDPATRAGQEQLTFVVGAAQAAIVLALAAVVGVLALSGVGADRYVVRRLWPDIAAGRS